MGSFMRRRSKSPKKTKTVAERAIRNRLGLRSHDFEPVAISGKPSHGIIPVAEGRGVRCRRCGEKAWAPRYARTKTCAERYAADIMDS
jgi:hypothetical protein